MRLRLKLNLKLLALAVAAFASMAASGASAQDMHSQAGRDRAANSEFSAWSRGPTLVARTFQRWLSVQDSGYMSFYRGMYAGVHGTRMVRQGRQCNSCHYRSSHTGGNNSRGRPTTPSGGDLYSD